MGVGSGGQGVVALPWIFMHDTDKVKGILMVLFFGLVFSVGLLLKFFLPTPLVEPIIFLVYLGPHLFLSRILTLTKICLNMRYFCKKL